jgi:hypothetical protein
VKSSSKPPSATSLPRAPQDDAGARSKRYLIMMGIRVLCFILMVVITPYGWYTWVFGAGAILLPYIAVVLANVSENVRADDVENPERSISAAPPDPAVERDPPPTVITIEETRNDTPAAPVAHPEESR